MSQRVTVIGGGVIGLCSAFFFVELLPGFFYFMFDWFSSGLRGGYMMQSLIITILTMATYLLCSILSISNSKQLALWISNKASLDAAVNFALNTKQLLFAFFLVLGLYGLIRDLPHLLTYTYSYFKESPHSLEVPDPMKPTGQQMFIQVAKVAFFIVLLAYAHVFATFFASRINNSEPEDEITEKTDQDVHN